MIFARTPRLLLLPLPAHVVRERLRQDDFRARVRLPENELPGGELEVHYPPSWPGDALAMFPAKLPRLPEDGDRWSATAVRRDDHRAVGQLSGKGGPDAEGRLEIGYGFNPEVWGQGLATEGVRALSQLFVARPEVRVLWAATAVSNPASARVLQKAGFLESGRGHDPEDGDLRLWTWADHLGR